MIHNMYAVYDEKAKAHLPPFILPELGMAIRTFTDCINAPDHSFGKHPYDYTLYEIATFDDKTATLKPGRALIGNGAQYVYPEKADNLDLFPDPAKKALNGEIDNEISNDA